MADQHEHQVPELPQLSSRQLSAVSDGEPLVVFRSLEAAAADPDAAVVLSGDYGGTIFLTVPVRLVRCSLTALTTLVSDLDAVTWMSGELTSASVGIERAPVGPHVTGGDGGGEVVDGVWTHPSRLPRSVGAQAADVVTGRRERIDIGLLTTERFAALESGSGSGAALWFDVRDAPGLLAPELLRQLRQLADEPALRSIARDVAAAAARGHPCHRPARRPVPVRPFPQCGTPIVQERIHAGDQRTLIRCHQPDCDYQAAVADHQATQLALRTDTWLTLTELVGA